MYSYLDFKLRYLQNLKLLSIRLKESFEPRPYSFVKKKATVFFFFLFFVFLFFCFVLFCFVF